jgi:hypothetical protein
MSPQGLAGKIKLFRPECRITTELERNLAESGLRNRRVWYTSQKEHWLGWLREYGGPGYYGRKNSKRTAEFVYNHVNCAPMLLWLGEACGVPQRQVTKAKEAALRAGPKFQAQCAAIRKLIPWATVEPRLSPRVPKN